MAEIPNSKNVPGKSVRAEKLESFAKGLAPALAKKVKFAETGDAHISDTVKINLELSPKEYRLIHSALEEAVNSYTDFPVTITLFYRAPGETEMTEVLVQNYVASLAKDIREEVKDAAGEGIFGEATTVEGAALVNDGNNDEKNEERSPEEVERILREELVSEMVHLEVTDRPARKMSPELKQGLIDESNYPIGAGTTMQATPGFVKAAKAELKSNTGVKGVPVHETLPEVTSSKGTPGPTKPVKQNSTEAATELIRKSRALSKSGPMRALDTRPRWKRILGIGKPKKK